MPTDQRVFTRLDRSVSGSDGDDRVAFWSSTGHPATPTELAGVLGVGPGTRLADVGAGLGYFAFPFARAVGPEGRVWAIEIDPVYVGLLRERKVAEGADNVEVVQNAGNSLGIPKASVDVVFACEVVGDVLNTAMVAPESRVETFVHPFFEDIRESLVPGGTLVIVDKQREGALGSLLVWTRVTEAGLEYVDQLSQFDRDFYVMRFRRPPR